MAAERRYTDEEVAFILQRASAAQDVSSPALPSAEGMTLAQLQEIGSEAGIAPADVAQAAAAVARGGLVPTRRRTWLGLPIGVSRTIDFGRPVSDAEWDQLVVELRETFAARGRVWREGGLRQWANGNLQALLEPTPKGHRLRISTRKGDATGLIVTGAALLILAAVQALGAGASTGVPAVWAIAGAALIVSAAVRLPKWARTRAAQMEAIAEKAAEPPPASAV